MNRKKNLILTSLTLLLIISFVLSLAASSTGINISALLDIFKGNNETFRRIILDIRLPRILNALFVGAALSCSGIVLQSLLKNSLAEPGLLGISAGAGLGAIIIFLFSTSIPFFIITPVSFIFALLTTFLIFIAAKGIKYKYTNFISSNKIILTGIALSAFISSINAFLLLASGSGVTQIIFWLSGGFSGRGWNELYISMPFTIAGIIFTMLITKELNLLSLGEELSQPLGLNIKLIQKIAITLAAFLAASAVSVAGIISFVGLIVPNISRLLLGSNHRYTVPGAVLIGGSLVMLADLVSRIIIPPSEIPAGIIIAFIGAPIFFWLIVKKDKIK